MKHTFDSTRLVHAVYGTDTGVYGRVFVVTRDRESECIYPSNMAITSALAKGEHIRVMEYPKTARSHIMFSVQSVEKDGLVAHYQGSHGRLEVLEYHETYRPDCLDCRGGWESLASILKEESETLRDGRMNVLDTATRIRDAIYPHLLLAKIQKAQVQMGECIFSLDLGDDY